MSAAWAAAVGAAVAIAVSPPSPETDEQRSAWRFSRAVALVEPAVDGRPEFATLDLPPELLARAAPGLRDLRLVGAQGREVPFVLDRAWPAEDARSWSARLADVRLEPRGPRREGRSRSQWSVDLGASRTFDTLSLDVEGQDFVKRLRIEASLDGTSWSVLREDAGVFDRPWGVRVHHTAIALASPATARHLRLTAEDEPRSPLLALRGVTVSITRSLAGQEWSRKVSLRPESSGVSSRYRLDLPEGLAFETLDLDARDPAFARRVVLREIRLENAQRRERVLAEGTVYRLRVPDAELAGACLRLTLAQPPESGTLELEVVNADSPPLEGLRVVVRAAVTQLVFPIPTGGLHLYYGNPLTRPPLYDLAPLSGRLGRAENLAPALLAQEVENPRYRKPTPLPFAALRGAPLDVTRWTSQRTFAVATGEDLYTLTLAPEDLHQLRADLADVRVVDAQDRQVPSILEPGAKEARLALVVEREEGRGTTSRYALRAVDPLSGEPLQLPIVALDLDIAEGFFSRPVRLLVPPGPGRAERTLLATTLERAVDPGAPPRSILLPLDGSRVDELVLEVQEGDNAPLTLVRAEALVRVPRIAFKAAAGTYRVLLGNPEAQPPRYDLARLRHEVLSYSAIVVEAGAKEPNPAFRRQAGDYLRHARPTLVLWAALVVAVVVLLALTARVLRSAARPGDPPSGAQP